MLFAIYFIIAGLVLMVGFGVDIISAFAAAALFVFLLLYSRALKNGRRF